MAGVLVQPPTDEAVEADGDGRNDDHGRGADRRRAEQAIHGFPKNQARDHDEGEGVGERRQDAGALVAEGAARVRGPAG